MSSLNLWCYWIGSSDTLLGSLVELNNKVNLQNIERITAYGVGAVFSTLMAVGYSIDDILQEVRRNNFIKDTPPINISNILSGSVISLDSLKLHMSLRIRSKLGVVPTLKQLRLMTGVHLQILCYNTQENRVRDLHEDTDVIEAIMMSCSLPLILGVNGVMMNPVLNDPLPLEFVEDNSIIIYISPGGSGITGSIGSAINSITGLVRSLKDMKLKFITRDQLKLRSITLYDIESSGGNQFIAGMEAMRSFYDRRDEIIL
jgi:hypothetical protein